MNVLKKILYVDSKDVVIGLSGLLAILIFIPTFTYAYFASDLQTAEMIMNKNSTGLILMDRNNKPFFTFYSGKNKTFVPLDKISDYTKQAIITAEDKDFYSHSGFSPKAVVGALIADIRKKDLSYGGSTITQQLVKNSLLSSSKDFLRKYQEVVLAEELERRYDKNQILQMYLNSVYFGEGAFGIEEAAQNYFGKSATGLDLAESAMIASVLPAPSMLSPKSGDLDKAKERQEFILSKMEERKIITPLQRQKAEKEKLIFNNSQDDLNKIAPHFALMVRDYLIDKYGEEEVARSGFKVRTTLDLDWQVIAEKVVKDSVANLAKNQVSNGAAVVIDPKTGEIKALVGSKDWFEPDFGKVNVVTSPRQVGSSFKPLVYAAGLEEGKITAATVLKDVPTEFPEDNDPNSYAFKSRQKVYKPKDYDGKYRGLVSARRALSNSLNIPSVEVLSKVGIPQAVNMAQQMGISTLQAPSEYGLSLVLGAAEVKLLELTSAYAVLANKGFYNEPTTILGIEDKNGNNIYSYQPSPKQVLSSGAAFIISSILSDPRTRTEVFGNALNNSKNAAVKTGTTEDYKDALTVGYTPSLAVGVWVGNNDGSKMDQVAGSLGAAPIWKALIEKFLAGKMVEKFEQTDDVVALPICKYNGLAHKGGGPFLALADNEASSSATSSAVVNEYFLKGTQPKQFCDVTVQIQINSDGNSQAEIKNEEHHEGRSDKD